MCREYMAEYINTAGGYLRDPGSITLCEYCNIKEANVFLQEISSSYDTRWRNFGLMCVYIVFNIAAAVGLYWLARMPKGKKKL